MGKHGKFEHKHVTGETDPVKIKRDLEAAQAADDRARKAIREGAPKGTQGRNAQ